MPDLSTPAIQAWVQALDPERPDREWPPAFRAVELQAEAPALLEELGGVLQVLGEQRPAALSVALRNSPLADTLRAVLAQAGSARVFRFVHWLDESVIPDSQVIVARLIEGDRPDAHALRATIAAFTRRQLLNRMFAIARLAALHAATQNAMKESP